jgi:hypothetical protein
MKGSNKASSTEALHLRRRAQARRPQVVLGTPRASPGRHELTGRLEEILDEDGRRKWR